MGYNPFSRGSLEKVVCDGCCRKGRGRNRFTTGLWILRENKPDYKTCLDMFIIISLLGAYILNKRVVDQREMRFIVCTENFNNTLHQAWQTNMYTERTCLSAQFHLAYIMARWKKNFSNSKPNLRSEICFSVHCVIAEALCLKCFPLGGQSLLLYPLFDACNEPTRIIKKSFESNFHFRLFQHPPLIVKFN